MNLAEIYALLESRNQEQIDRGLQALEEAQELKSAAEKRYLKFIQVRLGKPEATLADLVEASLSEEEEGTLTGRNMGVDFLSFGYFNDGESRLVVDFLGAMVAPHIDMDAHIQEAAQMPDKKVLVPFQTAVEERVVEAIRKEAAVYDAGWYGKSYAKLSQMALTRVLFDHSSFDTANNSPLLREYMFFVSAFTKPKTWLYLDIFQSDTPDLSPMFWVMRRIPRSAWGDVEPEFPKSPLSFQRSMSFRVGDDGEWEWSKSELA